MTAPYRPDNPFAPKKYRPDNPFASADFPEAPDDQEPAEPGEKRTLGGMIKQGAKLAVAPLLAPAALVGTKTGRGALREGADAALFGWGGEAEAAVRSAFTPDKPMSETLGEIREEQQTFKAEHPILSGHAQGVGSVLTAVPGAAALMKGAGGVFSKGARLAGIGATGGALAGSGTAEGDIGDRVQGGLAGAKAGAIAAPLLGGAVSGTAATLGAAPKLGRFLGITTAGGRDAAALKALTSAIQRSGQSVDDVLAKAETSGTLLEAMGPAARHALDAMAALGDIPAGRASELARSLPKGETASALARASRRRPPKIGVPTLGLKLSIPAKVIGAGLRKSATKESETTLARMLAAPDDFLGKRPVRARPPQQGQLGRGPLVTPLPGRSTSRPPPIEPGVPQIGPGSSIWQGPISERPRLGPGPRLGQPVPEYPGLPQGSGQTIGKLVSPEDMELQAFEAMLMESATPQSPGRVIGRIPSQVDDIPMGYEPNANPSRLSQAFLDKRNKFLGTEVPPQNAPSVSPKAGGPSDVQLRALAEHLKGNQEDNLETLIKLSIEQAKRKKGGLLGERGALGVEPDAPMNIPAKIKNPTDPYQELKAAQMGPDTPELARVKLLRKTYGMSGKLDLRALEMLLGLGGVAGGGLTAALALQGRARKR